MTVLRLTASTLLRLAGDRRLAAEFPFLAAYARPAAAGCCGRGGGAPAPGPVIRAVFGLPPDRRARFKELAGAARVVGRVVRALRAADESF